MSRGTGCKSYASAHSCENYAEDQYMRIVILCMDYWEVVTNKQFDFLLLRSANRISDPG